MDDGKDIHLDENGNPRIIERRFSVSEEHAGLRLDHFMKRQIPRLSRTRLQEIIRSGGLERASGRPVKANARVTAGDELVLRRPAQPEPPCPRHFDVLYKDDVCMVVDKPAGLPVHASAKFYFNTLTRVLSERFPDEGWQIAHRIDRETSGCLVVARGAEAAAVLKGAFANKSVDKTYLAVVHGDPPWPDADSPDDDVALEFPLRLVTEAESPISVRMTVADDGLPSITKVRVLERRRGFALVRCTLITGRQHQIRAHMAAAGHPLVGDKLYGHGDEAFARFCDVGLTDDLLALFLLPRQALHAATVTFPHPTTRERKTVEAPLPADLREFLNAH